MIIATIPLSTPAACGAITHMDRLGYGDATTEAEARHALGERQTYCQNCGLCRWPEEQRTCPLFVRSDELERYYATQTPTPT